MRLPPDAHKRLMAASELLLGGTISVSSFEHVRTIVKGLHPELDKKLDMCSEAFDALQKIQSGDVVTLSVEGMSDETEEKKQRKKALLFFIRSLKNLESEIKRVEKEVTQANQQGSTPQAQLSAWGRVVTRAKGPLGIVTVLAVVIVSFSLLFHRKTPTVAPIPTPTVTPSGKQFQIILYNGKQVPLSQLYIGRGSDCDSPHYHAVTGSVTTIDGTVIPDPENCGYGKVKDVQVLTISQ